MDLGLADSVCLVTGSTGGIGLATAELLRAEGATVVTTGRGGGDIRADLAEPGEPERVVAETIAMHGRLDVLVNNVGYSEIRKLEDVTDEDWQTSFEINLMTAVRATRAALPGMRERGAGTIVNVSSTAAKRPSTGMPDYSVMKAALLSFSRLVADLYAKDGIRCNAVTPGPTATQAWLGEGGLADQQGEREEVLAKVAAGRPLGRLARAGGDRRRDRLPLLAAHELRHRRRVERRRRHRSDHPLGSRAPENDAVAGRDPPWIVDELSRDTPSAAWKRGVAGAFAGAADARHDRCSRRSLDQREDSGHRCSRPTPRYPAQCQGAR